MKAIGTVLIMLASASAAPAMAAERDCHIGLSASGVYGKSQHVHSTGFAFTDKFDVNGRGVGAEIGCLAARNRWRYGAVADVTDTNAKGTTQERAPNSEVFASTAIDWLASVRAVGGYQLDSRALVYLTGGLAVSSVNIRVCAVSGPLAGTCSVDAQRLLGAVGGVGAQYRLSPRWSLGLEYLVFGFEKKGFEVLGAFQDRKGGVNPTAQVARVGLNLHF
jgi:opacity protein-like surface antigen